ncbi:colicin-like bacteriocin tRNase domain-containing protein [Escherichia coli]|uniref:colicin-like bacteriocin tRNase domain-containing protein n=1 Tax=Escherichia coli TaxID=562 RepID=UPI0035900DAD
MSDNEGSVPTEGIDYGDTMVVWPSTGRIPGGDVKPGGSSGLAPSMPPGWGDYSPQGIALVQSVLFPGIIRRIILDKELEEGDWSGWSVSGHCCKVSDEAAFCLIQRPYISKTLLTRRISPRGSP